MAHRILLENHRNLDLMRAMTLLFIICFSQAIAHGESKRPNILMIVADDLGFSDLGCYGSEIETPHLDSLAHQGVRLTQFYTTGRCCPSRASLLTGYYPHRVGLGHMTKDINRPGYRGRISGDVQTIAQSLTKYGYRSFLAGKWHLGTDDPTQHGFEEFYGTLVSAKTFWQEDHFLRYPKGRKARDYSEKFFYGTDALTDHAIDFLKIAENTPDQPWFLYLAFNAPHFPLHAPTKTISKYKDSYRAGWDQLRLERLQRMKNLGIVSQDIELTPRSEYYDWAESDGLKNPAWDSLPSERRVDLARRMAIYAAMIDRLDQNVGRVLMRLKDQRVLDNTLVVFTSDNGACAEWDPYGFDIKSGPQNILHRGEEIERMGSADTYHSVGSGWANASNTPWRLYKHFNHEGGISVPCILHWTGLETEVAGSIDSTPTHLIDLLPTFLDANGENSAEVSSQLPGKSLLPLLKGEKLADRILYFEHEGNRAVRDGRWKLVALRNQSWELYDISVDREELDDLAKKFPEVVEKLDREWSTWAEENNVTPLPDDYGVAYLPVVKSSGSTQFIADDAEVVKLADGFRFTEGPVWNGEAAWYFSDLPNKTLHRWTKEQGVELIRTGTEGFSNGIVIDSKKNLIFCEVSSRRIIRRSLEGKEVVLADSCDGKPIGMPNDLWYAPDGSIYFTIPKTNKRRAKVVPKNAVNGTVCRISADGKTVEDVGLGLTSPNGIVGTSDGKYLFVADPGAQKCWRFDIQTDGSLKNQALAADKGSDGLAVDKNLNLYVTGDKGVMIFSPDAKQIGLIPVPEKPANMKFGGHENRMMFITARTGIYSVEMNVQGN